MLWVYLGLVNFVTLMGIVFLFVPQRRRLGELLLCSVGACLLAGCVMYWAYPMLNPEPSTPPSTQPVDQTNALGAVIGVILKAVKDAGPSIGWAVGRIVDSFSASAVGLLVGWFPLWLWFRFRQRRAIALHQ